MPSNESVGKKIVEALKKQAEEMDVQDNSNISFEATEGVTNPMNTDLFTKSEDSSDIFAEPVKQKSSVNFFDDIKEDKDPFFDEPQTVQAQAAEINNDNFEMPANITVLKKLISQLPSGVSRHTGAQIIKQTMEALGISMKSVLQDAQQVQESLKVSARECQASIQEYKKQIIMLEKQSQNYQKQYSALNDLISLFIQTTK